MLLRKRTLNRGARRQVESNKNHQMESGILIWNPESLTKLQLNIAYDMVKTFPFSCSMKQNHLYGLFVMLLLET